MQEANQYKDLPNTSEEDEAFKQMENIGLKEMFTDMGKDLGVNAFETPVFSIVPPQMGETPTSVTAEQAQEIVEHHFRQHAPAPQPTLEQILKTIGEQFALLATVITQQQGNSPKENDSLQECVSTTLEQSDWFKEMVEEKVADMDFDDTLEGQVERYCENYFSYSFDPKDHFDIGDAVADRVDDKIGDEVERAVEEYMSNATLTIEKG